MLYGDLEIVKLYLCHSIIAYEFYSKPNDFITEYF